MTLSVETPARDELMGLAEELAQWQQVPWAGQLHPGDLGWHSSVDPGRLAGDLENPASPFPDGPVNVAEARGAPALQSELRRRGWVEDEEWTPLVLELTGEPRWEQLEQSGLCIESVGAEGAVEGTAVHWSSFKGTPYTDEARQGFVRRWSTLMTGPFAERAQSLIGYDPTGAAVAVTTVWSAGEGRPGLMEPMGVHRDHQGKGYGVAITQAGARALHQAGASAAAVVAENSNPAALAAYTTAGFTAGAAVSDLARA